jgi:hypothetical protein
MHDWTDVASDAFAAIFHEAEGRLILLVRFQFRQTDESKDDQMKLVQNGYCQGASNEDRY